MARVLFSLTIFSNFGRLLDSIHPGLGIFLGDRSVKVVFTGFKIIEAIPISGMLYETK